MELYSFVNLESALNHYDLPLHDDFIFTFKNRSYLSKILKNKVINGQYAEVILYSLDFEKHRKEKVSDYHFSYVMTKNEDCMYLSEDIKIAEDSNTDERIRLLPFVEMEYGDYLCFYFKDFSLRPEIVFWYKEESEPDNAHITYIARDLDELISIAKNQ